MCDFETLKALFQRRLTATAGEIVELLERKIAEYEETLCQHRKLLDAVLSPQVRLHRTDVQLQSMGKEEVPSEKQERTTSADQYDPPQLPCIKVEQDELWTRQEGNKLKGPDEADIIKFTFNPVPVKNKEDKEKPQSSHLHHMDEKEVEDNGEDRGGPEPEKKLSPDCHLKPVTDEEMSQSSEAETDVILGWEEADEPQSNESENNTGKTPVGSSERASTFGHKQHRQENGVQTGVKQYSCSVCGKKYTWKKSLTAHMRLHSEGKSFSCAFCQKTFPFKSHVLMHMRIHTGEKPFSCSVCDTRFTRKEHLSQHMRIHSGERPFSCSLCGKGFAISANLIHHMRTHTGEKPFSCSICDMRFSVSANLKHHMRTHTGEKPFSCSVCDKSFTQLSNLNEHKCVGESSEGKGSRGDVH